MITWNQDLILQTLLDAGEIALQYFKKTKNTYKKDGSIVTEADIAVEKFLKSRLHSADQCWIGEETAEELSKDQLAKDLQKSGFIVDPIDGTMNYANGLEMWGISIGYFENGKFTHGAVYLPCCREIFITSSENVSYLGVEGGQITHRSVLKPIQVSESDFGSSILAVTQAMAKNETVIYSGGIHSLSSAVYTISKLILGSYSGYIGRLKLWDIAAVYPMCQKLGIEIVLSNGHTLEEEIHSPQFVFTEKSLDRFSAIQRLIFAPKPFVHQIIAIEK